MSPPSAEQSSLFGFIISAARYRWAIVSVFAVVVGLGVFLATQIQPEYSAHASVIVTLGPEYSSNPDAGSTAASSQSFLQKEIIKTESSIITNADLHRTVLKTIGVQEIYPELFKPPSGLGLVTSAVREFINSDQAIDPRSAQEVTLENALILFNSRFYIQWDRDSAVLNLTFRHKSPRMAARIVEQLLTSYLELRREIYSRPQSDIVANEVAALEQMADKADLALLDFQKTNDVSNLVLRRELLMKSQQQAEQEAADATAGIAQTSVMVNALVKTLDQIQPDLPQSETNIDLRMQPQNLTDDALNTKLANLLSTYMPDSPQVQRLRDQIKRRQSYIDELARNKTASTMRSIQNPLWVHVTERLIRAQGDYQAMVARKMTSAERLQRIAAQLRDLQSPEAELSRLERLRQAARDTYSAASKTLGERRLLDNVQARKQDSVRVLESATIPGKKENTRSVVAMISIFGAFLLASALAIVLHYTRRSYLTRQELEHDAGVAVLGEVSEGRIDLVLI